jgi:hypothetical protein
VPNIATRLWQNVTSKPKVVGSIPATLRVSWLEPVRALEPFGALQAS